MNSVVSKDQPLRHYNWGTACDGWNLVDDENLSIKQERMPAGATEEKHVHHLAQQFFYILKGTALFEIEDTFISLAAGEGILIKAGQAHCICNQSNEDLEFILCSQPAVHNDRFNV